MKNYLLIIMALFCIEGAIAAPKASKEVAVAKEEAKTEVSAPVKNTRGRVLPDQALGKKKVHNYSDLKAGRGYSIVTNNRVSKIVSVKGSEKNAPADGTQVIGRTVKDGKVAKGLTLE